MAKKTESNKGIIYVGPFFHGILRRNGGPFPDSTDREIELAWACWYTCRNVHIALDKVPSQVSLEGDTDLTVRIRNIVNGSMQAYGLNPHEGPDLNDMMNLMPIARNECFKRNLFWSDRWQAWLDSAGKAYDEVTREPDQI